jgi:hypothetical protein
MDYVAAAAAASLNDGGWRRRQLLVPRPNQKTNRSPYSLYIEEKQKRKKGKNPRDLYDREHSQHQALRRKLIAFLCAT